MNTISYQNTFIIVSEDSPVEHAVVPLPRNEKPTIASIEYDLIHQNPYEYTQEEVQFLTYLVKNPMESTMLEETRERFLAKPKPCFRASPLVKKFGWGIHYNDEGKISIYDVDSENYQQFLHLEEITILKGMRSKRK